MNDVVELIKSILDLVRVGVNIPEDWNDEEQVVTWLTSISKPLGRVIVLIVPDATQPQKLEVLTKIREATKNVGDFTDEVGEFDWNKIIDWLIELLVTIFPAHENIIRIVGTVIKQLISLIQAELNNNAN